MIRRLELVVLVVVWGKGFQAQPVPCVVIGEGLPQLCPHAVFGVQLAQCDPQQVFWRQLTQLDLSALHNIGQQLPLLRSIYLDQSNF